jgi:Na+/H+-translocating membrane pyrophosphatase
LLEKQQSSNRRVIKTLNAKRNREGSILSKGQSKKMSLVESSASVIAGYIITVLIQYWLYPLFGISIPVTDALVISVIIVFAAFVKNFSIRRLFNFIHIRSEAH